jgi:hypothetical protein
MECSDVDSLLGDLASLDRLQDVLHLSPSCWTRHFKIKTSIESRGDRVGSTPVAHDQTVPAPFSAQDLLQKESLRVCVMSVHLVVCSHDGARFGFLDGNLERLQVDLPQCPFADDLVDAETLRLLLIRYEMFYRS